MTFGIYSVYDLLDGVIYCLAFFNHHQTKMLNIFKLVMHIFSSRDLFWLEQKYDPIGLNKRRKSSLSTNLKSTNRVGYLSHEHLSTLLFLFNKSSQTLWGLPKKKNLIANLLLMTSSCKRERKLILGTFSFNLKPPGWGK